MNPEELPWDTTTVKHSGITSDTETSAAVLARSDIFHMTQQAQNAVVNPTEPGAWPSALRAALASRIATLNQLPTLAAHYAQSAEHTKFNCITDPANDGSELKLQHVLVFMDSVALQPRETTAADIEHLKEHSVSDADIVRLAELNAFLAYQIRVVSGMMLLGKSLP